ncbi:hypothetical protein E8E14_012691 [Neopestalotiopsis sp. 37M]|nr:hypothetical protein E8E14_012691 [Neopestalotiopsis sp. 37M]
MRALRYYGPGDIRLESDVPEPKCQAHQVKIRPSFCGICGSDLHAYYSPNAIPFKDTPHPITGEKWPVTLGHEFSGEIVEVGSDVPGDIFRQGDRVAVQPTIHCGECLSCKEGLTNCCACLGFVGLMGWGGGLSDYVCVDAKFAFKLPDSVPLEVGALVEPLAVAWHAVERSDIKAHDNVLIMGAGPIGLAILQCLKPRQTRQIIVAEVDTNRRRFAQLFGATTVINPLEQDVIAVSRQLCNGHGPDIAFECAGVAASIKSACASVRSRGTVVNVSVYTDEIPFDMGALLLEKQLLTALSYTTSDFAAVIGALDAGILDVKDMITKQIALDRVVDDGILALAQKEKTDIKILVDVRA